MLKFEIYKGTFIQAMKKKKKIMKLFLNFVQCEKIDKYLILVLVAI